MEMLVGLRMMLDIVGALGGFYRKWSFPSPFSEHSLCGVDISSISHKKQHSISWSHKSS